VKEFKGKIHGKDFLYMYCNKKIDDGSRHSGNQMTHVTHDSKEQVFFIVGEEFTVNVQFIHSWHNSGPLCHYTNRKGTILLECWFLKTVFEDNSECG
jgi:hypothetical protein